ncbi:hypothetical protein HCA78_05880 [Listeria booriae]|uniref:Uncharacterized protein n=1 Tax=Listeria booriae TaxID=1552123 RepID=A0A842CX81_9LIST|nr:hypothetical protein [Listeria booriae]MBC2003292.1 hypothetical protein [Listeria booriae]
MIVKCVSNEKNRYITTGKRYSVISGGYQFINSERSFDSYRIIDDMGTLSIYEATDFTIISDCLNDYEISQNDNIDDFVHKGVSYVTFYEDYYNDIIDAKVRLESVQIEIYRCECSKDELIIFLCSDIYSNENYILLKALSKQLNEFDIEALVSYFNSEFLSQNIDFAEEFLYLLSKYKNENVYQYFLDYFSAHVGENQNIDQIISTYFDEYYL